MPLPTAYRHATRDWQAFLADACDALGLVSDNMAYTAVDAVLQVFRRRLTPAQVIAFGDVLPAVLRAILVYRWQTGAPPEPWAERAVLTAEAQAIRRNHNLTPDHAIAAVSLALRGHVRVIDLDRVLADIGPEAQDFWSIAGLAAGPPTRRIT